MYFLTCYWYINVEDADEWVSANIIIDTGDCLCKYHLMNILYHNIYRQENHPVVYPVISIFPSPHNKYLEVP